MIHSNSIIRRVGLILLCTLQLSAYSQSNYMFTPSIGAYSSISGTDITSTLSNYTPINIGFTFNFDGVNYTQVVPSKNGWLSFNTAITSTMGNSANNGNLTYTNCRPLIGALFTCNYTNGSSKARYTVTGTAPNRVFVFEWYYWQWHWYTSNFLSCEIKLYETSNKIECVYNPISSLTTYYCCTSIGLAFTKPGEYLSLSDFSSSPSVSNTSESHNFESQPVSGLTYTFNPVVVKTTPTNQCSNLSASIKNDNIILNWTDASGSVLPDGYLVMASKTNSFADPIDGTSIIQDNDLADGTGMVIVLPGQQSYFGWNNAESSTNYYFKIFSFSNGGVLVKYNKTAAPTALVKFVKAAPVLHVASLQVKNNVGNYEVNWTDASKFGQSIYLSGRNSDCSTNGPFMFCPNTSALDITGNAITLEAWINPEQTIGDIFQKANGTLTSGYRLYISTNGQICFGLFTGTWNELKSAASSIPLNAWSYVCATYDGSTQKIYLNGNLIAGKSTSGNIATSTEDLAIGASPSSSKNYFIGKIDEISVWSKVRSQAEVLNDMAFNIAGNETGLAAYFKCNNNTNDSSPNSIGSYLANTGGSYKPSNISPDPDGYLLQASTTNTFPSVVNGTDIATDNDLADGIGAVKVAQGIQTFGDWMNIDVSKQYYFKVIPYSNKGSEIVYYTGGTIPQVSIKPNPTNHVTGFTASSANCNIVLNWTDAIGTQLPEGYVILASTSPTITAPANGTEISIDNNLSDGTGAVKVLSGVQTCSGWTGFISNTTYYFNIYPYTNSNTSISYKIDGTVPQTSGRISIYAEPTNHASGFTANSYGTLTLNWSDAPGMPSLLSNALNFDGSNDLVTCSGSQNPSVFSAEAWFNTGIVNADMAIASTLSEGAGSGFEIHVNLEGKPVVTVRNSSTWLDVVSPTVITANKWTHVAVTYDGTTVKLYVDGQLMNSAALPAVSFVKGTSPLVIGRRSSGLLHFNGSIDDVRIWSIARSQVDIQNNMNNELFGYENGLLSYYKFNQGTAGGANAGVTTLTDATTNAFNGTLSGFALTGATSNWINPGQAPSGYLIKASTTNSFTDPVDGTEIATDNDLSDGAAVIKVSQGTQIYSSFSGTKGGTTYYFKMWSYTNSGNYINYKTAATVPTASIAFAKTKPITHVTSLAANNNNKVINVGWTDAIEGTPSFGNAIDLDGINDFVAVPTIGSSLSKFTIETWFKASSLTGNFSGIYNNNSWVAGAVHFQINSGNIELAVAGGATYSVDVSFAFAANTWYHLAATYNAGAAKIYINGALIGSGTLSTATVNLAAAQIGAWNASRFYAGKFDEYRIWNTQRTQSDIFNNMFSELTGSESGLIAYYKFNQGTASGDNTGLVTATDASSNVKNGTLTNFALTGTTSNWVSTGDIGRRIASPDGYLIKASKTNNITAPANGTVVADDNNLADGVGAVNILAGVQTYNGWTNFTDTTAYYYKVYPYSNSGISRVYNTMATVPWVKDSVGIDKFKEITTGITGLANGKSKWGDYDNDGDLELLMIGSNSFYANIWPLNCVTKLYDQNADHTFTEVIGTGLVNVSCGDADWGDYNNDGLLDLIITGVTSYASNGMVTGSATKLYKQNPDHSFTEQSSIALLSLCRSSVAWGDYDNDGDLDFILSGYDISITPHQAFGKIYRNNGNNSFTAQSQIVLDAIYDGSVTWGDYDNDGFLDILLTGDSSKGIISKVYKNNKNNFFFEQKDITIPGAILGSASWGDYDNDGDLDILLNGGVSSSPITTIYKNNYPENTFTEISNNTLTVTFSGSAQWGDINNDGNIDVIVTGDIDDYGASTSKIFLQNSDHSFLEYSGVSFKSGSNGLLSLADFDNDKDLDFFITGSDALTGTVFTSLYQNNLFLHTHNDKPNAPTGLTKSGAKAPILSWNPVSGDNTPTKGLSYNIRIGKTPTGNEITSPMAENTDISGFRKIVSIGNCQQNTFKVLNLPPAKNYYWSVQAIDNGFLGGAFSEVKSFDIDSIPAHGLVISKLSDTEVKVKWERGNGNRCAVFCVMDSSTNSAKPIMGKKYVHDNTFTEGDPISSSGWYCVYNGEKDSVIINGLFKNTTFTVQVVEYILGANDAPQYYRCVSPTNDDWGIFSTSDFTYLPGLGFPDGSNARWADFNNDGYLDFICKATPLESTEFYVAYNNGDNSFTKNTSLGNAFNEQFLVADFNNDEHQDILYTYQSTKLRTQGVTVYTAAIMDYNDATHPITYLSNFPVLDYDSNQSFLCDYNHDGYVDIIVKGEIDQVPINKIFYNNHDKTFTEGESNITIPESFLFDSRADYDNDGDIDIYSNYGIAQNDSINIAGHKSPNRNPETPTNLNSRMDHGLINLSWNGITTDETPEADMTYDIRLKKEGDETWFNAPPTALNGYRRTVTFGKYNTNSIVLNLPMGQYEWQVQSIDRGYKSSNWSPIKSFTISSYFTADTVCLGDTTFFFDKTFANEDIIAWKWIFDDTPPEYIRNPKHVYLTTGDHLVKLIVTNSKLQNDTVTGIAYVKPIPTVSFAADDVCEGLTATIINSANTDGLIDWIWDFGDGKTSNYFNPGTHVYSEKKNYTIKFTVTAENNCPNTAIKTIAIKDRPSKPTVSESINNFCPGTEVKLEVNYPEPDLNYQWKRNGDIIDGATSKSYAGKLTAADYSVVVEPGSCATESDKITLTTKPAPPKPNIYAKGPNVWILACDNASASDYRWYYNDQLVIGAKSYQYVANQSLGNYYVEISDGGECYTMSDVINIPTGNISSGIDELVDDAVVLFPNPTDGRINIALGLTLPGETSVQVIDALGNTIACYKYQDISGFSVDLAGYPKGFYYCKISNDSRVVVKKIIKQ